MKANITQIESTVTPSGNSGHVVVPKAWIGKEAMVTLKEKEKRSKGKSDLGMSASTIEKLQEPKKAGVKFQTKDLKSRVSVSDTIEDRRRQRGQSQDSIAEAL
ncbi:MAG: DUF2080 family transposase-associated protein [Nitrososphaeraceae archaeon]